MCALCIPAVLVHILLSLSQISCPPDYRLWQQTMYCHFGQKWAKLHHGPLWSVVPSVSTDPNERNPNDCNTMQVRKNITVKYKQNIIIMILPYCLYFYLNFHFSIPLFILASH